VSNPGRADDIDVQRQVRAVLFHCATGHDANLAQFDGVVDIGGGPLGARLSGTYVRQLPANILARVTRPSQPFVGPDRLTLVRWDPGDIVSIGIRPTSFVPYC
jgi:hypothetical protein